jgi:hypothetical protein
VIGTCQPAASQYLTPACSVVLELSRGELTGTTPESGEVIPATLELRKNRSGPSLSIPLDYQPRASVFEERP